MAGELRAVLFETFDGGWNPRDSPYDLDLNESPDCYNCTIDTKGSVGARLGYTKSNQSGQPAAVIVAGYYSDILGKNLWQAGNLLYTQTTQTDTLALESLGATSPMTFVDFDGYVYAAVRNTITPAHAGVWRSADGITWTQVTGAPQGDTIAVWQNKLWVAANDSDRVHYSVPGGGATWTGTGSGTVDIHSKDGAPVTALHASETEGLLAYKEESCYRIYDSSTGAFQTLDVNYGAANHYAVVSARNTIFSICQHGIFATDGNSALAPVAEKLQPLWNPGVINFAAHAKWCAGVKPPNVYFSLTFGAAQTTNNLALEVSPDGGAIMPHSCAAGVYVLYGEHDMELLGSSPTANGQVHILYDVVGTDDGADIASRFQTAWVRPNQYGLCRYRELLVRGSTATPGGLPFYSRVNGATQEQQFNTLEQLAQTGSSDTWGSGTWGDGEWGPTVQYEVPGVAYSFGVGEDISFEFFNTSDDTFSAPAILDTGSGIVRGNWHISGIRLSYVDLGRAVV